MPTDFRYGQKKDASRALWWKLPAEEAYREIFTVIDYLDEIQVRQRSMNLMNYRLYGNAQLIGMTNKSYNRVNAGPDHRVTLNVIQSICDTMTSTIASNKPKPTFLVDGGNFEKQQIAERLDKFVQGIFYETKYYERQKEAVRDSTVWGTGVIKVYKHNGRIKMERVVSNEIKIDEAEAIYGYPRQLHQVKYCPREVLLDLFKKDKKAAEKIKSAQSATEEDNQLISNPYQQSYNMIKVAESWHLPSGEDAKDGRHVISISSGTLFDDPKKYDKQYFPFLFYKWKPRLLGFWAQGIAEQLWGIQTEINKILRTIQIAMHLGSIPKIFVEMNSKVVQAQLNNEIGSVIKYTGVPPRYEAISSVSPELFRQLDWLYQRAYEIIGVSQLTAQSKKPAGLDSKPSLREYNDIGTARFLIEGQRLEEMALDCARQVIDLAKEIDEENKEKDEDGFSVMTEDGTSCETIEWKDVNLIADQCVMKLFPTSILPTTPEGKRAAIDEMVEMGYIDRTFALKLFDSPDLKSYYNMENAAIDDIQKTIKTILYDGKYISPEPLQNLQLGISMMTSAYLRSKIEGAPAARKAMIQQWIATAQKMIQYSQQASLAIAPFPPELKAPSAGLSPEAAIAQAAAASGLNGPPMSTPPTIQ